MEVICRSFFDKRHSFFGFLPRQQQVNQVSLSLSLCSASVLGLVGVLVAGPGLEARERILFYFTFQKVSSLKKIALVIIYNGVSEGLSPRRIKYFNVLSSQRRAKEIFIIQIYDD